MNKLEIFKNQEFGTIRTVTIENEPWFVGKNVASALGYKDTSDTLKKHVYEEDKLTSGFADIGQMREMYIINESGLYSLILSSKLPSAKNFKRWVTSEVLPSIRKSGAYINNEYLSKGEWFKIIDSITNTSEAALPLLSIVLNEIIQGKFKTLYDDISIITDFISTVNVIGIPTSEIYSEYVEYCEVKSITPISNISFPKMVNKILGTSIKVKKIDGITKRIFTMG